MLRSLVFFSVAIPELVGWSHGRPLVLYPVATGLAPGVGGLADNMGPLGFLRLGDHKASGLVRGVPDPGRSCSWRIPLTDFEFWRLLLSSFLAPF